MCVFLYSKYMQKGGKRSYVRFPSVLVYDYRSESIVIGEEIRVKTVKNELQAGVKKLIFSGLCYSAVTVELLFIA